MTKKKIECRKIIDTGKLSRMIRKIAREKNLGVVDLSAIKHTPKAP